MTTVSDLTGGVTAAVHAAAKQAMVAAFGQIVSDVDPLVRSSEFADFQLNAALPLAKVLKQNPKVIAQQIADHLDLNGVIAAVQVSGPGYLNLTVSTVWLETHLPAISPVVDVPQTIVIDYSSPNVAKEMHVGHIRTTIVGDALARLLEHAGNHVIRQNHIGDWGTPFGMLIEYYLAQQTTGVATDELTADPNAFYRAARQQYDTSTVFANLARQRVVKLQSGDPATINLWQQLVNRSIDYFSHIYDQLNVSLTPADIMGESAYDNQLAGICQELIDKGLAVISDGALCVFPDGYTNKAGQPLPLMLRKKDGGYTYATTDLAAAKYRLQTLQADQILYVVGEAQATHLNMIFDTVNLAGWNINKAELIHVKIGNMLGGDGKLLRTRSGESVKLADLIQDAVTAAQKVLNNTDIPTSRQPHIAQQVGIGALKYADLALDHATSYMFDLQRMVALTGNTGPYLQYTCVRINSILRQSTLPQNAPLHLTTLEEKNLAFTLAHYPTQLDHATTGLAPHVLCAYLFDLAQMFSRFYTQQQVLKENDLDLKLSRLHLCALTLQTITEGLTLLGIQIPDQM